MKPTKVTGPTSPTRGRDQKQKEIQTYSLEKGHIKHSKLDKIKRQRNIVQMKEQGKKR